ncbi:TolC family protein [Serpentinimonas barnesii]|uniref:TolC family protein n=1 Tax=Serpentinimonas barnesii TaxID=1458427 RepID=UPI000496B1A0|nr:TolC family protein [Serpentinimonas barnesii]
MFAFSLAPVQRVWRLQRGGPYAFLNPILGAALLGAALSGPAWAHGPAHAQAQSDWRAANELVGGFPRGHADIVHWEAQQVQPHAMPHPMPHTPHHTPPPPASAAPQPAAAQPAAAQRWSLADALMAAQRARPDLLAKPGQNPLERAELRLAQANLALQVERAWLRAVAAGSSERYQAQELQAAQAGAELAARLVRVGNWPQMRLLQEQLLLNQTQAQWRAAQHQQHLAVLDLWRLAGSGLTPRQLEQRLPTDWPTVSAPAAHTARPGTASSAATPATPAFAPLAALEAQALQAHPRWPLLQRQAEMLERGLSSAERASLAATLAAAVAPPQPQALAPATLPGTPAQPHQPELTAAQLWPHTWDKAAEARAEADALERQIRADVHSAYSAWQTATELAEGSAQDALRLHTALQDETQQRYNGMLKSTWELLASASARVQSAQAALLARRDAAVAAAELRAVLDGLPYSGSAPAAAATPEAAKGK